MTARSLADAFASFARSLLRFSLRWRRRLMSVGCRLPLMIMLLRAICERRLRIDRRIRRSPSASRSNTTFWACRLTVAIRSASARASDWVDEAPGEGSAVPPRELTAGEVRQRDAEPILDLSKTSRRRDSHSGRAGTYRAIR